MENLDALIPENKIVRLFDKEIVIPGESPVKYVLSLMAANQEMVDAATTTEEQYEKLLTAIYNVLEIENDLDKEEFLSRVTLAQSTRLTSLILNIGDEKDIKKNTDMEK